MKNQIQGSLGTTHQGRNDMKFSFKLASALAILMLAVPVTALAQPKKIVLGFSQIGAESEWRTANTESIKQAAKDAGIELKFSDAQQKQENQIKAIRSFIAQRVDVIAFSPVVESGWETVLKEAKSAGIPVILSDRAVDVKDDSLWVSFMGSDFVEEGRRAANWLVEYLDKKGVKGDVNIVGFRGSPQEPSEPEGHSFPDRRFHPSQGQGSHGSLPEG
jgi:ABC-type sugar transport system substrate-binding protein